MKSKLQKEEIYQMQAEICGALAHPIRLQILELVSQGEKTSSDLLKHLKIPKANLSQHLAVLKSAGILESSKVGQFQVLQLGLPGIKEACAMVQGLLVERLDRHEKRHAALKRELKSRKG